MRSARRSPRARPTSTDDPDERAAGDDEDAGGDEARADASLCLPISRAAKRTAQSDCVAFSGATIDTRPRSNASSRLA